MSQNLFYRLADGRLWDVRKARWVSQSDAAPYGEPDAASPENALPVDCLINLVSASGQSDEAYLARTLKFYDYPLGELAAMDPA